PRRGHERARRGDGGQGPGGARRGDAGPHDVRHRAPPGDRAEGEPHPGARGRPGRRAGDVRRARRARRALHGARLGAVPGGGELRMAEKKDERASREYAVAVFWDTGLGFWRRGGGTTAWALTIGVIAVTVVNLGVQYLINAWHRGMFDAIEHKDAAAVLRQSLIFLPLTVANVALAVAAVWTRLTTQRAWRAWFNGQILDRWLNKGRYYQLNFVTGEHQNPEYRIADDLRVACDALVDFAVGIMNAVLSALTFIGVLWFIGGAASVTVGGRTLTIPGFLVVAAVVYAAVASGAMVRIGHGFVAVTENKNQAEAEYRYGLTRLRENGESIALLGGE